MGRSRTGFFTALKAAPRVQTTTLSQAVVVNPAPLSDDDDDDGRKRHSPEMPARTPRRTTLLLWSLFRTRAHRDAHTESVSSLGSLRLP